MRPYIAVVVSSLIGGVIGGLILAFAVIRWDVVRSSILNLGRQSEERGVTEPLSPTPIPIPSLPGRAELPPPHQAGPSEPRNEEARKLAAAGRLREAQEEYLEMLLQSPGNREAMAGLVAVRRRLARGDPVVLRRQAAVYQQAIARGAETEEHYTVEAMKILAEASLLGAAAIEGARGTQSAPLAQPPATPLARVERPSPRPPTSRPTVRARRTPRPTPRAVITPAPAPTAPRSTPTPAPPVVSPAATPAPQPSLDVNEPFFLVQVGPIADGARASEIAADLTLAGYSARVSRPAGGGGYFITLGPYRRSVADTIVKTMRARYGAGLPVTLTPAS